MTGEEWDDKERCEAIARANPWDPATETKGEHIIRLARLMGLEGGPLRSWPEGAVAPSKSESLEPAPEPKWMPYKD